jgi:disease resistance protein RPM1
MIQVSDLDLEGEPESCRVHDMMLDLICDLANEENFVTIMDTIKGVTSFGRKVRRLSVQKVDLANTGLATSSLSQVRSFTSFSPAINQMLSLSRFEVLRVLDLEGCNLEESGHLNLSCFGNLLHLRYLGLRDTKLSKITTEIGNLLFLQTLDLKGVDAKELPANVLRLRNLMFLYLSEGTHMPVGYKNLTSLEQLSGPHFTEDDDPEELCYLTELRVLMFCLPSRYPPGKLRILLHSLGELHKLYWVPSSPQFNVLKLDGWSETMPTMISFSSLPLLSKLDTIYVHQVRLKDIQVLGTLPILRLVRVQSSVDTSTEEERFEERSFMLNANAFPRAVICKFQNVIFAPHMFSRGALPKVQDLRFGLLVSDILVSGEDLCLRNLPSLKFVSIKLYGVEQNSQRYSEEKATVYRAAAYHPNRPQAFAHTTVY